MTEIPHNTTMQTKVYGSGTTHREGTATMTVYEGISLLWTWQNNKITK